MLAVSLSLSISSSHRHHLTCLPLKQIRCPVGVLRGACDEALQGDACRSDGSERVLPRERQLYPTSPQQMHAQAGCPLAPTDSISRSRSSFLSHLNVVVCFWWVWNQSVLLTKGWSFLHALRSDASRPVAIPAAILMGSPRSTQTDTHTQRTLRSATLDLSRFQQTLEESFKLLFSNFQRWNRTRVFFQAREFAIPCCL